MICLITGANGFLGKFIAKKISLSHSVFGLSRSSADFDFFLEKQVPNFNLQFDVIIHTAGKAHVNPKSDVEKMEFHQVNVVGTQNLLRGLEKSGLPSQFVFISSVAEYGLDFGHKIDETHELNAIDPLGLSKIQSENIVIEWCKKYNVRYTILRLPLIAGANPPGNFGAMLTGISKGYYVNVAGGNAKKSMVLADDVANIILKIAAVGGIYNLTDGYHPTLAEISENISSQLGKKKPLNIPTWLAIILAKIGDLMGSRFPINTNKLLKITSELTFDDIKARTMVGWNPKPVLEGFRINKK